MKASRFMIASAVAALLPMAGAMAQAPAEPPQKGATFESLDANGDGKISKDEAAANAQVTAQFSRYDQNGDGFIEKAEVESANQPPASETPKQ